MKAVCPTCGFENQAAAGHAVCGRCATIIEVQAPALAAAAGAGAVKYPAAGPPGRWLDDEVLDLPEAAPGSPEASDPEPVFDEPIFDLEIFTADAPEPRATSREESYVFLPAVAPSPLGSLGSLIGGQSLAALLFIAVIVLGGLAFHFQVRSLIVGRGSEGDRPSPPTSQAPVEKAAAAAGVEPAKQAEPSQPSPEPITPPAPAAPAPEPRREEAPRATKPRAEPTPSDQAFVRDRGKGNLTLQVGAYVKLAHASERAAQLQSAGVRARVVKAEVPGQRVHYRIVAGRFTSSDEARRYGQQLRAKGAVRDFIVTNL
jgi:SPOR domain